MERLSGMDAAFLYFETPSTHMHVAMRAMWAPSTRPGGSDSARGRSFPASRLHLVPPFRRRVVQVPFRLNHPIWVEDPNFDLDYHIRRVGVPSPGGRRERVDRGSRQGSASAPVVGVLEAEQGCARRVEFLHPDGSRDGLDFERSIPGIGQGPGEHVGDTGSATELVLKDVRLVAQEDFVARPCVSHHGQQVGHRAARDEEGGFLAEELRRPAFQRDDRGVIAENVVTDFRLRHGLAHGRRRPGDGVAPEVDDGRHARWRSQIVW